jgi:hypothetical protein
MKKYILGTKSEQTFNLFQLKFFYALYFVYQIIYY